MVENRGETELPRTLTNFVAIFRPQPVHGFVAHSRTTYGRGQVETRWRENTNPYAQRQRIANNVNLDGAAVGSTVTDRVVDRYTGPTRALGLRRACSRSAGRHRDTRASRPLGGPSGERLLAERRGCSVAAVDRAGARARRQGW